MNDAPRRRSPRGLMLLAVAAAAVLAGLGTWQIQRLGWKEGLIAERKAMLAADPVALSRIDRAPPAWRRVRLRGTFLHERSLLVGPRSWRGAPHWRLVTPLRLAAGWTVLVDRGRVPHDRTTWGRHRIRRPAGEVAVDGIVRYPGPPGPFTPEIVPSGDEWLRIDPPAMAGRLSLGPVAPFWVAVQGPRQGGSYPAPDAGVAMPPNNHLQYAITWYGLALGALAVAGVYWRRARSSTA